MDNFVDKPLYNVQLRTDTKSVQRELEQPTTGRDVMDTIERMSAQDKLRLRVRTLCGEAKDALSNGPSDDVDFWSAVAEDLAKASSLALAEADRLALEEDD